MPCPFALRLARNILASYHWLTYELNAISDVELAGHTSQRLPADPAIDRGWTEIYIRYRPRPSVLSSQHAPPPHGAPRTSYWRHTVYRARRTSWVVAFFAFVRERQLEERIHFRTQSVDEELSRYRLHIVDALLAAESERSHRSFAIHHLFCGLPQAIHTIAETKSSRQHDKLYDVSHRAGLYVLCASNLLRQASRPR
jgi:hypothetical protein